jgi:predicted DCC family thiol-disulfide oxidoreductase YuxK
VTRPPREDCGVTSDASTAFFVYDGDCAFCTTCAQFIERRVPTGAKVVPWQFADLESLGLTQEQCEAAVQWVAPEGATAAGPDAIALLLRASRPAKAAGTPTAEPFPPPWLWRIAGRLLQLRLVRVIAWPAYRWVARNRHRLPGGTAACALPQEARERLYGRATAD